MNESTENATAIPDPRPTSIAAGLGNSATSLTEHRGAQSVEVFSTAREELAAMLTEAGVYDLGWRALLRCAGRDRVRWLNGMVTNSVKDLQENAGCYAFVLNAQGRIQGDLDIYRRAGDPDALWLATARAQIESLLAFVRRYIIMDQVTLDLQDTWTAIGIAGPEAANKLRAAGLPVPGAPIQIEEASWRDHPVVVVSSYSPIVPRYEIWMDPHEVLEFWRLLTDGAAAPCGVMAMEQLRILEGTPAYGIDIGDRDLPQETNQLRALNFNKGCYLGQEIVERIRSRGNVHRTFSGFVVEGDSPAAKSPVLAGEKAVGELTSAARIAVPGNGERVLALGTIRREALESKEVLMADGNIVMQHPLPFDPTRTEVQP